jgi:heat shock protein HtpX
MRPRIALEELLRRHANTSRLLTVLMFVLLCGLGTLFALPFTRDFAWLGTITALVVSVGTALVAYRKGADWLLTSVGARPVAADTHSPLTNVVEEMTVAAGIPRPQCYVVDSRAANSFATCRHDGTGVIVVTSGLVESLEREELQAVIAHEVAHIKNHDVRFLTLVCFVAGIVPFLCEMLWQGIAHTWDILAGDSWGWGLGVLGIAIAACVSLWLVSPLFKIVLRSAISRRREFLADALAVRFTRNPEALCEAIRKLSRPRDQINCCSSIAHAFFVNPAGESDNIFASHPRAEERIREIRKLWGMPTIIWGDSAGL